MKLNNISRISIPHSLRFRGQFLLEKKCTSVLHMFSSHKNHLLSYSVYYRNEEVPIYNFTNARQNPTTWKFLADVAMEEVVQSWAFSSSMWYPSYISVTFRPLYLILHLLLHKIPGLIIDFTCILTKRKPM